MKTLYSPIAAALALMLLAGSCKHKEKDTALQVPEIDVAQAFEDSVVVHKSFPALVEATSAVDVVAQANGRILRKCFSDGDYVERGAVLYEIDSQSARASVAEARAAIAQAQGQYDYYVKQSAAMRKALEQDAVAKITVDEAESNVKTSAASLASAKAQLEAANVALAHCRVTAPVSGRVENSVQQGSYASAGGVLAKIVNNSDLKVTFSIDEAQYSQLSAEGLREGESSPMFRNVPVKFEGVGDYVTDLYYVSPSVDVNTGTITMQGKLVDPGHLLRDGMYATVELPVSTDAHATLVLDASIATDLQGKYLYVVNDSDKVVYTPVKTGETIADTLRIVTSGIKPGQRYVKSALLTVRNGMKVKPVMRDSRKK